MGAEFWLGVAGTIILVLFGVIGKLLSMRNQNIEDNKIKNDAELKVIKDDNDADVKGLNEKIDRNLSDAKKEFHSIYTNMTKMELNSTKHFGDVRQDISDMSLANLKEIGKVQTSFDEKIGKIQLVVTKIQALCELNTCDRK